MIVRKEGRSGKTRHGAKERERKKGNDGEKIQVKGRKKG